MPPLKRLKTDPTSAGTAPGLSAYELEIAVREAVDSTEVIDVHTHLFPPSHSELMLWGIDELLTYHYCISEFFMVAPADVTYEEFFKSSKSDQADLVWEHLFVRRSPLSEAQIGVLTVLIKLGLRDLVDKRDLPAIRAWFKAQDPAEYANTVFEVAKIKYIVMTNVPFDPKETKHWLGPKGLDDPTPQTFDTTRFKTALRIDPLLKGDWGGIALCLKECGLPETIEGAKTYLRKWAQVYKPLYLMASTPADFVYGSDDRPRAEGWPTATDLIDRVMVPLAKELKLPLALKLGAMRGMNPNLNPCGGGDGVIVADVAPVQEMASRNPEVKFLVTFLSRVNQHQVCILSQKFRNVHIYGCWWYCNNPSIIEEITKMRMELLGTAFTAQHSDCRIMDQLIYKWSHSRRIIADVLVEQFSKLHATGWSVTREDVQRDVWKLLGGSFEEFIAK